MVATGSPPLTRGKVRALDAVGALAGITPAYAGKSNAYQRKAKRKKDHPRLRGEKREHSAYRPAYPGSPPLTRGKVSDIAYNERRERITPAYAGKSIAPADSEVALKDHPRLRGEKQSLGWCKCKMQGSPPLTRGKELYSSPFIYVERITPAYAGKSPARSVLRYAGQDHPRLRGEKSRTTKIDTVEDGSPPLTRGKGAGRPPRRSWTRITPAYAGKSFCAVLPAKCY